MKKQKQPTAVEELYGFDDPEAETVDEDDLRWGFAVPEGWKHRERRRR